MAEPPRKVRVVDYDLSWPRTFEVLRQSVWPAVCDVASSLEHVGSTAVPGLAAKPIIDMDVVVASRDEVPEVIARLSALGYTHKGNLGIEDREAFQSPEALPAHHLYVCLEGSAALENHLALREFLRREPTAVMEYGRLKKQLARRFPRDIDGYIAGKTDYIVSILRSAGVAENRLEAIRDANR